jgi:hypothetical protein
MKNVLFILSIYFLGQLPASSQEGSLKKGYTFRSSIGVGFAAGQSGSSPVIQMVNGFGNRNVSAGIGIGIDGYHARSVPLFLQLQKEFLKGDEKIFIYADGGINNPWVRSWDMDPWNMTFRYERGAYFDAGGGYKLYFEKWGGFLVSAGYTGKGMRIYTYQTHRGPAGTTQTVSKEIIFDTRITLKIGWIIR